MEAFYLAVRHGIPPKSFFIYDMHSRSAGVPIEDYIHRFETKPIPGVRDGVLRVLNSRLGGNPDRLSRKDNFSVEGRAAGLRTVPSLVRVRDGEVLGGDRGALRRDVIVKPDDGAGGRDLERWDLVGDDLHHDPESGELLSDSDLLDHLRAMSQGRLWLVQPRIRNHPDLEDLGRGVLTTVRVQSALDERLNPEIVAASFRMPVESRVVDNMHRGGIASAVDLSTGELGRGVRLKANSEWVDSHPIGGARIAGRVLPDWPDARALVLRAHGVFRDAVFVAWDVALSDEGPVIVEANVQGDVNLLQKPLGAPLGATRFGVLMAHHIRHLQEPLDRARR